MSQVIELHPAVELDEAAEAAEEMVRMVAQRPVDYVAWLPGQVAFLSDTAKETHVKMARWGNQWGGKTWAGLAEVIWRAEGKHPFIEVPPPPVSIWIVCASWTQSVEIQRKFWELVDQTALTPGHECDIKNGFGSKNPTATFRNGSIVRWRTTKQGGLNLASATLDAVLFDEPPPSQRLYTEILNRVMKRNGPVLITMTPVNADVRWLRALVEAGQVNDHHFRFTAENLIPVGEEDPLTLSDGTPMDAAWVAEVRKRVPAYEAPVVLDGEWEFRAEGRVFDAYRDTMGIHLTNTLPTGNVSARIGFDHGSKILKQTGVLVCLQKHADGWPIITILDEDADELGDRTPEGDARATLAMLARSGLTWGALDEAWGDRSYQKGKADKKSNRDLQAAIALQLKLPAVAMRPSIRTVKRGAGHGAGSVFTGVRWLHHAMLRPGHFFVHERCKRVREALLNWEGADDVYKDRIDAIRYALDSAIFAETRASHPPTMVRTR